MFLFSAQILNYVHTIEVVFTIFEFLSSQYSGTWPRQLRALVVNLHFYTELEPLGMNVWGRAGLEFVSEETLGLQASVNLISIPCLTSQIGNSPSSFLSTATALVYVCTDLWGSMVVMILLQTRQCGSRLTARIASALWFF